MNRKFDKIKKRIWKILDQRGQTSVEYLLMTAVVVVMVMGVGKKIEQFLVGTGKCPSQALICRLIDQHTGPRFFDSDSRFRYFSIRR